MTHQVGDQVGGDRGEHDAVPVVPGGDQHARPAGQRPEDRRVVRGARAQPGDGLDQVVLGQLGHQVDGGAQQVAAPPRR